MSKFRFAIDTKKTIWERCYFVVEASTIEEAREKTKELFYNEKLEEEIEIDECETLYDTSEDMATEENDNQSTQELMENGDRGYLSIATNVDEEYGNTKNQSNTEGG